MGVIAFEVFKVMIGTVLAPGVLGAVHLNYPIQIKS